jgi:alcohol dehydrogenase (cytochrome c)
MYWSTNRRLWWRGNDPLTPDEAEREEVAMARGATHLVVMAVVGISLLLGHTEGTLSQEVTHERLLRADKDPNNWIMYYGNYQGWRYSALQQINATNVKRLVVKWQFRTGSGDENLQVTPLVVDGVMYLTNQRNEVFALQAETGTVLWRYTHFHIEFSPQMPDRLWGHAQHRGVAVTKGKVLLATQDAHLVALNAKSGEELWKTRAGDPEEGHMFTSPPLIVKDKAILGIVTGERPTRGFIDAYGIETGKREWRFYTVPGPGEPGHETWGGGSWLYGCGPAWLPGTYDAALNLVYFGIGNPCPTFSGEERPGDNLYTNAIVALDPETGQLQWSFQVIPHDLWDYDAANELVLVDIEVEGNPVKALLQANKNGYVYALDRTDGRLLYAKPFVARINWTTGLDATGRPSLGALPTPEGAVICPSAFGAKSWNHMAYHPERGQLYLPAIDMCARMKRVQVNPRRGVIYTGGEGPVIGGGAEGALEAIDVQTGERRWHYRSRYPMMASVLATGGGLVLTGDVEGNALAFDAATGELLWSFGTGSGLRGSPISYAVGGRQYIAVPSGWGGVAARNFSYAFPSLANAPRGSTLFVFGLSEE